MKNLNFWICGSSNAQFIELEKPIHPIYHQANVFNKAVPGSSAILSMDNCFVKQIHSNPGPNDYLIIVNGTNQFENHEYYHYKESFKRCINFLIRGKGWPAARISVILALPRGNDFALQIEQMSMMDFLKRELELDGVKSWSVYDHLPSNLRDPIHLFSRRSYTEQSFNHYAREVRKVIHEIIAEILIHKIRFRMRIGIVDID